MPMYTYRVNIPGYSTKATSGGLRETFWAETDLEASNSIMDKYPQAEQFVLESKTDDDYGSDDVAPTDFGQKVGDVLGWATLAVLVIGLLSFYLTFLK